MIYTVYKMMATNRKNLLILTSSLIVLGAFMMLTNPDQVPLYLLLIPFILIFFIIFVVTRVFLVFFFGGKGNLTRFNLLAMVISIVLVNFILLRSVDQLTIQDAVLSTAVTLILGVYINKFRLLG